MAKNLPANRQSDAGTRWYMANTWLMCLKPGVPAPGTRWDPQPPPGYPSWTDGPTGLRDFRQPYYPPVNGFEVISLPLPQWEATDTPVMLKGQPDLNKATFYPIYTDMNVYPDPSCIDRTDPLDGLPIQWTDANGAVHYYQVNKIYFMQSETDPQLATGCRYAFYQLGSDIPSNEQITILQAQVTSLQNRNNELSGQLAAANTTIVTLQAQVSTDTSTIAGLQTQVANLQTQVANLQAQLTTLNGQLATAQGQVTTLTNQAANLQTQLAVAQTQNTTLQTQLNAANDQNATLQTQLNTANATIASLQAQVAKLVPEVPAGAVNGLMVSWFKGTTTTGTASRRERVYNIDFNWASVPPLSGYGPPFAARFEGYVTAPSTGAWVFSTTADDGTRLWINGVLVIDNWKTGTGTKYSPSIQFAAGQKVPIKLEYFNNSGQGTLGLLWAVNGGSRSTVPFKSLFIA